MVIRFTSYSQGLGLLLYFFTSHAAYLWYQHAEIKFYGKLNTESLCGFSIFHVFITRFKCLSKGHFVAFFYVKYYKVFKWIYKVV